MHLNGSADEDGREAHTCGQSEAYTCGQAVLKYKYFLFLDLNIHIIKILLKHYLFYYDLFYH
jgi:hypothetical protein